MDDGPKSPLSMWIIAGEDLLKMLNEVKAGEEPGVVYAQWYANSEIDHHWDE